jgi:hypothetical protein
MPRSTFVQTMMWNGHVMTLQCMVLASARSWACRWRFPPHRFVFLSKAQDTMHPMWFVVWQYGQMIQGWRWKCIW